MRPGITVVIPTIAGREKKLRQAVASVINQSRPADAIIVMADRGHVGAAETRNRALDQVDTEFTAFLDDDDYLLPEHLKVLELGQQAAGSDVTYGWYQTDPPGMDPVPWGYRMPFDEQLLRERSYIFVGSLCRTELAVKARFRWAGPNPRDKLDDWGFYLGMLDLGASFIHVPAKTYVWRHWGRGAPGHPGHTSGDPEQW